MLRLTSIFTFMNPNGNFLVYKSSAGSGKTYTLVKEYLSIALGSNNSERYKNILAITFTNKAASEMKERVTTYLKAFCSSKKNDGGEVLMFNNLKSELNVTDEKLKERSFKMLKSILHNYSDFNITTIDKFILKIIKSFSFDLQLPYNFEVELDSDSLLNEAINNLLSEAGKDKRLTAFLVNYVKQLAQNDESWNIQSSLLKVANISMSEDSLPYLNKIKNLKLDDFSRIKDKIRKELKVYEEYILNNFKEGKEKISESGIISDQLKGKSKNNILAYFNKKIDFKLFEEPAAKTYFQYIDSEEWCSKGFEKSIPYQIQTELKAIFYKIENYKADKSGVYVLKQNIQKNLFQLGLLNELEKKVNQIREEQNFIHISEFNKKIAEVVIKQPIPFIYERIGEKFKNYLIDEFQDTSILQWQNLLPLLENSLAYNNKNLIVGDAKQAIYRWRGGDVDQFTKLPENPHFKDNKIIKERIQTLRRQFNPLNLEYNYRSKKEIIEFNNLFFKELTNKLPDFFTSYYAEYEQKVGIPETGGYAEIKVLPKLNHSDLTLEYILDSIQNCKKRGRKLSEIALLTRTNKELTLIAEFLTHQGIAVISNESLNLNQSSEVTFLVNLYASILDPKNIETILQICKFLNTRKPLDYFAIFKHSNNAFKTLNFIIEAEYNIILPNIFGISIYEAFEELISSFKIKKSDPFIQTFLDLVKKQSTYLSGTDFIEYWMDKKESIKIASPQKTEAITLMTIHKSKGLEFPIVFLPFANATPQRGSWLWLNTNIDETGIKSALIQNNKKMLKTSFSEQSEEERLKAMLDELNVVYVAVTRAADEIYISVSEEKDLNNINGVEKFFHQVLPSLKEEKDNVFSLGKQKLISNVPQNEKLHKIIEPRNLIRSDWRKKIKMSFSAPSIWNVPENSDEIFPELNPKNFGNIIHTAFSRIEKSDDSDNVLKKMLVEGLIEKESFPKISKIIKNTLSLNPLNKIWNEGRHIVEREIITEDGISYRPDRIILKSETTYLFDFKTGEEKKVDEDQLLNYKNLLKQLKFKNIKCFLLYTDKFLCKKVM